MIGVIAKVDEIQDVEEFFQLFKTPWELYQPGRQYDVVIASVRDIPEVDAMLVVIYGSDVKSTDALNGIAVRSRRQGISLKYQGFLLPIYGSSLTFDETSTGTPCVSADSGTVGLRIRSDRFTLLRLGYDLFQEVRLLLSAGQPTEQAHIPTLDIHIRILRDSILNEGMDLVEIPPVPAGHSFIVCLTHDIDFVGIRNHRFDHSMWGFLYRSTFGAIRNLARRRISLSRLFKIWRAALSLPFVYLGWTKDFWDPFDWYLRVEKNLPTTYFLIPFKGRPGEHVTARNASRRATAYDIADIPQWSATLLREGSELGVHGIDSWHSVEKGREESARIATATGESKVGIRMHWLLHDENTFRVLEEAGYAYDSSVGYNETIGYRSGTTQAFCPSGARTLLELPLHIQDGALFYPQRLDLSEPEAFRRCADLIDNVRTFGGVLTVLWHDRSHGPERFWGDFYINLVQVLKSSDAWFATAAKTVGWFRKRREVRFERAGVTNSVRAIRCRPGDEALPPLRLRVHRPQFERGVRDIPWDGSTVVEFDSSFNVCELPAKLTLEIYS